MNGCGQFELTNRLNIEGPKFCVLAFDLKSKTARVWL